MWLCSRLSPIGNSSTNCRIVCAERARVCSDCDVTMCSAILSTTSYTSSHTSLRAIIARTSPNATACRPDSEMSCFANDSNTLSCDCDSITLPFASRSSTVSALKHACIVSDEVVPPRCSKKKMFFNTHPSSADMAGRFKGRTSVKTRSAKTTMESCLLNMSFCDTPTNGSSISKCSLTFRSTVSLLRQVCSNVRANSARRYSLRFTLTASLPPSVLTSSMVAPSRARH
mmetsp:Transcript_53045/g.77748  ORF Transcript_53045/g.77748 Transcript_53045/m.77748 type:complete len:229 (+) Transcript_53045:327-1013(+)